MCVITPSPLILPFRFEWHVVCFNPVALRKAKTPQSYCLSECNGVIREHRKKFTNYIIFLSLNIVFLLV